MSLSLAVLEVFVHMTIRTPPDDYVPIAIDLRMDESHVERVDAGALASDWRKVDHPALQAFGAEWVRSQRSLALLVPSVVVEGEWNVLINPRHPLAGGMRVQPPKPFYFDERMFR